VRSNDRNFIVALLQGLHQARSKQLGPADVGPKELPPEKDSHNRLDGLMLVQQNAESIVNG
jgi:hypothetical protein